jgi:uracil-DNA glycosylase
MKKSLERSSILMNIFYFFEAFNRTPFDAVKVVILGRDPYHGKNQANGLAFSVSKWRIPPSLKNIFKELQSDLPFERPTHGSLESWADQLCCCSMRR